MLPALHSSGFHHPDPKKLNQLLSKFTFERVSLVIDHTNVAQEVESNIVEIHLSEGHPRHYHTYVAQETLAS